MKITKIKKVKYGYSVTFDEETFMFEDETVLHFYLHKGKEIDSKVFKSITLFNELALIKRKALMYLKKPKTEKEFKTYLRSLNAQEAFIESLTKSYVKLKYLDDKEYARIIVEAYQSKYGFNRIQERLRQKGISQAIIDTFKGSLKEDNLESKIEKAVKLSKKPNQMMAKNTLLRQFLAKGYAYEAINPLLDQYLDLKVFDSKQHLENTVEKLMRKYKHLDLSKRNEKIRQTLYQQGFSQSNIEDILNRNGES
ncbi:MAG: RecX family transcriptional regulator [Acholeplasma sp.]|nr:RecX family transcriptional regulator [Acholeplasma sp.]